MTVLAKFLLTLAVVAWAHGAYFPGRVGLNENGDLVLNSGEKGTVLANGVDLLAIIQAQASQIAELVANMYVSK